MRFGLPVDGTGTAGRGRQAIAGSGMVLALLAAIAAVVQWPEPAGVVTGALLAAIVYAATVDVLSMRLPNSVTYPGVALTLIAAAVAGIDALGSAAAGAAIGFAAIGAIALLSRGQVGMGDVKFATFGGALVGGRYVLPSMLLGSLSAVPVVLVLILAGKLHRKQPIPFGPFLAVGFVVVTLVEGSVLTR